MNEAYVFITIGDNYFQYEINESQYVVSGISAVHGLRSALQEALTKVDHILANYGKLPGDDDA